MATVELDVQPQQAYAELERADRTQLLDAIDDAIDVLETDPGDKRCRERSFREGRWGISVRGRSDDWLIIWERDQSDDDLIVVRYLGADPYA
jgi:hypothetical protein